MDNIPDSTNMGRDARVELVLDYLVETGVALPVACLHRNLVLNRHATFSSTSLRSYLKELHEEGLVRKIDNEALDQREVVPFSDRVSDINRLEYGYRADFFKDSNRTLNWPFC